MSWATELAGRQAQKMARSPHAFVRGNTIQHYSWLSEMGAAIPEGPPIWICGDCHVGNLGPTANTEGRVDVQIRDLDQTTIGNPAHDIIRLALSLASAARGSNIPGVTTANMIEQMVDGYEAGLQALDDETPVEEPPLIATVKRQALGRKWRHLAKERIRDIKTSIPKGDKFWSLDEETCANIATLLNAPSVKELILTFCKRRKSKVELVDAAYWVKGCSSLGKLRYAALVRLEGAGRAKMSLVDIKEAVEPAAPRPTELGYRNIPENASLLARARSLRTLASEWRRETSRRSPCLSVN